MPTAKGVNGTAHFDGLLLSIDKRGGLGPGGLKQIPLHHITGQQFKPGGPVIHGYWTISLPGPSAPVGPRTRLQLTNPAALRDDNSLIVPKRANDAFTHLVNAINHSLSTTAMAATHQPPLPQGPPAGWYPDPHGQATQRWWDGTRWTEHTHA